MVIGKNHNRPGGLAIVVDSLLPYSLYLKTTKKGKLEYQRDELIVHLINFGMDEIANPRLRREPKPKALKTKKAVA